MMEGKIPSQNLIKQVNPQAPMRRAGFWKPIAFDVFTVLSAAGLSYFYKEYLANTQSFTNLFLAAGAYGTFFAIQVFLDKSYGHRFLILLLEVAAISGFFYDTDPKILGIAGGIILAFLFWGETSGRSILDNGLEIKFFKTASAVLKKFTTAMVLGLIVLYIPRLDQNKEFVSKDNFRSFFDWSAGFVNKFYPEIDFSSSFDKLAVSFARLNLQNNQDFKNLSLVSQESAIGQASAEIMATIGKGLGTAVSGNEPVGDVVYKFIVNQLGDWRNRFGNWFLLAWSFAAFLIIRGFGMIFYYVVDVFAFIIYQILLASGFIQIIGESRTHEVVVY